MNLFFKNITRKQVKAFTLLEVIAAFAIVTLVILGPLTNAVNSSSFALQTKDVMVSTYLAEEAIELLHYQHDTLYLACINNKDACDGQVGLTETPGGAAWRIFKNRLNDSISPSVSCFDPNTKGCSYDFLDMLQATSTTPPKKYNPTTSTQCSGLSTVKSNVTGIESIARSYYVCKGDEKKIEVGLQETILAFKASTYSRSVFIESKKTFDEGGGSGYSHPEWYNDDLIITATVSFRRSNGVMRSIKVIDFLHARS